MMINDDLIISIFYNKETGRLNPAYELILNKSENIDILNYLKTRFKDSNSIKETLYRIYNKIETPPFCPICGNIIPISDRNFYNKTCSKICAAKYQHLSYEKTCIEKYGVKNVLARKEIIEKKKETYLKNYGVDNPAKSKIIQEKIKETCIEKYDVDNVRKSQIIKNKIKQTCKEKYGEEYYTKTEIYKEQSKNTFLKNYGVDNIFKLEEVRKNIKKLWKEKYKVDYPWQCEEVKEKKRLNTQKKYGVDYTIQLDWVKEKALETKRRNKTFNTSKIEEQIYQWLLEEFPENDIIRQYKEERYPFCCDFYIKSLDLFIEIQGTWSHGPHPFDKENPDDIKLLEEWKEKSKKSKYYEKAVIGWTIKDVEKRNKAKENNLIFLEIFDTINKFDLITLIYNII